jgi:hypothetical protein
MGQTAVIPAQIVDVAARSLLGNNTASADAAQTISFSAASSGDVLTVQGDGSVAFAAPAAGGITSLNGLTAATQVFAVGTTGTDVAFVSATGTHTLNIPDASATARGLVTTASQTFAGNKSFTGDISSIGASFYEIRGNQGRSGISPGGGIITGAIHGGYKWTGGNTMDSAADLVLERDAANTMNQRRTTNAQTFRVTNTYTSSTAYEWLSIAWSGNVCTITTEKGSAGGTLRGLKIGDAATALLGFYGVTPVDQPATVTDPTGGGTVDAEARTAIEAIIDRLQELGLIA